MKFPCDLVDRCFTGCALLGRTTSIAGERPRRERNLCAYSPKMSKECLLTVLQTAPGTRKNYPGAGFGAGGGGAIRAATWAQSSFRVASMTAESAPNTISDPMSSAWSSLFKRTNKAP